jgi:Zn-dependent protease with chaperone function/uncharacterized tellurite resistance protein B-like protein
MNFFEHQDRARRNTSLLVFYFIVAVLGIVCLVSLTTYIALAQAGFGQPSLFQWITSQPFFWSAGLTLFVILSGSLFKLWQLRDGGEALAEMLGASEILPDTESPDQRRLRNVVEEMSLASGIPAPRTYVLSHEQGINAFVAGYRPSEAVVMVTQGTLAELNRDELQGVIAHEFSHIFNADMRINMRLMAVLAGILTIGKVGEFLLHSNRRRGFSSRRSSGSKEGSALIILGLALMAIGYIGLFCGRLIKAAISRQRELLADASAVQFTRNPSGLAGALINIRNGQGSLLDTVHAEDMSHMCFSTTVPLKLNSLLATHPPLDERLAALGPDWVTRANVRARQSHTQSGQQASPETNATADPRVAGFSDANGAAPPSTSPSSASSSSSATAAIPSAANRVGVINAAQLGYGQRLLESIPTTIKATLHSPNGARQVVFALAILASQSERPELLKLLSLNDHDGEQLLALADSIDALGSRLRLPLLDLSITSLKQLSRDERDTLCSQLDQLVQHDGKINPFEFLLLVLVLEHLNKKSGRARPVRFRRYAQVARDIQLLLSLIIYSGGARDDEAATLFNRARGALLPSGRTLLPASHCTLNGLHKALLNLRDLTPLLKGPLVDTLADIIVADRKIQVAEIELLRAVCSLMDCPVPPVEVRHEQHRHTA